MGISRYSTYDLAYPLENVNNGFMGVSSLEIHANSSSCESTFTMKSFSGSLSPLHLESIVKESSIQKYHNDISLHSEDFQESTCLVLPDLIKATITCIQKSFPYGLKGNQFVNEKSMVDYWKYINIQTIIPNGYAMVKLQYNNLPLLVPICALVDSSGWTVNNKLTKQENGNISKHLLQKISEITFGEISNIKNSLNLFKVNDNVPKTPTIGFTTASNIGEVKEVCLVEKPRTNMKVFTRIEDTEKFQNFLKETVVVSESIKCPQKDASKILYEKLLLAKKESDSLPKVNKFKFQNVPQKVVNPKATKSDKIDKFKRKPGDIVPIKKARRPKLDDKDGKKDQKSKDKENKNVPKSRKKKYDLKEKGKKKEKGEKKEKGKDEKKEKGKDEKKEEGKGSETPVKSQKKDKRNKETEISEASENKPEASGKSEKKSMKKSKEAKTRDNEGENQMESQKEEENTKKKKKGKSKDNDKKGKSKDNDKKGKSKDNDKKRKSKNEKKEKKVSKKRKFELVSSDAKSGDETTSIKGTSELYLNEEINITNKVEENNTQMDVEMPTISTDINEKKEENLEVTRPRKKMKCDIVAGEKLEAKKKKTNSKKKESKEKSKRKKKE